MAAQRTQEEAQRDRRRNQIHSEDYNTSLGIGVEVMLELWLAAAAAALDGVDAVRDISSAVSPANRRGKDKRHQ